jgi:hypothetical protein
MGNCDVFGLSRAVRHNSIPTGTLCSLNSGNSFAEGADLIWLNENGVCCLRFDATLQKFGIGDEKIIANELCRCTNFFRKGCPVLPIIFIEAVLDRDNREFRSDCLIPLNKFCGTDSSAFSGKGVLAIFI